MLCRVEGDFLALRSSMRDVARTETGVSGPRPDRTALLWQIRKSHPNQGDGTAQQLLDAPHGFGCAVCRKDSGPRGPVSSEVSGKRVQSRRGRTGIIAFRRAEYGDSRLFGCVLLFRSCPSSEARPSSGVGESVPTDRSIRQCGRGRELRSRPLSGPGISPGSPRSAPVSPRGCNRGRSPGGRTLRT